MENRAWKTWKLSDALASAPTSEGSYECLGIRIRNSFLLGDNYMSLLGSPTNWWVQSVRSLYLCRDGRFACLLELEVSTFDFPDSDHRPLS